MSPDPDANQTHVPPGGTFETPTIFVGAFAGGPDGAGNIVRRWVVDDTPAHRMTEESAQLGLEMFHLDAGWFRGVGDWLIADPPAGWNHSEPFKGITIDLGVPAAHVWTARELERVVSDYHLDMLEHDGYLVARGSSRVNHAAAPPHPATLRTYQDSGYLWADGSNSTDVSYHATHADASFVLPPALLESYVENTTAPRIEICRNVLRSGMLGGFR